jgi:hypothetical protein
MDKSITSLPVDMGLTSCKEVYFFPPLDKWCLARQTGVNHQGLDVHPAMYPNGVSTLRFDDSLTQCDFGTVSDLQIPTSIQSVVYRGYHNVGRGALTADRVLRGLPASVSTCVLTKMHGQLDAGVLPKNLRSLTLDGDFVIYDGVLPLALESLKLVGDWLLRPKNLLSRCQAIVKLVLHAHPWAWALAMDHSTYPPNLETLVLGPYTTERNTPLQIPGSVKTLVFHMKYTEQLAGNVLPEGLTHLELVDVDFVEVKLHLIDFPQSLQYVKISNHSVRLKGAIPERLLAYFLWYLKSLRPDILVEVGSTEYEDVFVEEYFD